MTKTVRTVWLFAAVRPSDVPSVDAGSMPVQLRDRQVGVADHRVVRRVPLRLLDVVRPPLVVLDRIDAQADDLRVALVELGLEPGHVAQLGRADRREVLGVREQHAPRPAEPLVKADAALGRFRLEVGCDVAKLQCHETLQFASVPASGTLPASNVGAIVLQPPNRPPLRRAEFAMSFR